MTEDDAKEYASKLIEDKIYTIEKLKRSFELIPDTLKGIFHVLDYEEIKSFLSSVIIRS